VGLGASPRQIQASVPDVPHTGDDDQQRLTRYENRHGRHSSDIAGSGSARRGRVWHFDRGTPPTGSPVHSPRRADNAALPGEHAVRQPIPRAVRPGRGRRPPLGDDHGRSRTSCGGHSGGGHIRSRPPRTIRFPRLASVVIASRRVTSTNGRYLFRLGADENPRLILTFDTGIR
jgi:hypothetical protein